MKKLLKWLKTAFVVAAMCVIAVPVFAADATAVISWTKVNWASICEIITIIIALASAICKFTPTPKDDTFLAKVKDFISVFSIFNSDGSSVGRKVEEKEE